MLQNPRFWTFMILFQVFFGLAVFLATRAWYLDEAHRPVATAAKPQVSPQSWPQGGPAEDLSGLASSFPAPGQDPQTLEQQGHEAFERGEYQQAAHLYDLALTAGNRNVNTYNSLGLTLQYLGRTEEALAVLADGIAIDPTYQRIWLTLGFVNGQAGNAQAARDALNQAIEINPDNDIGRSAADMLNQL